MSACTLPSTRAGVTISALLLALLDAVADDGPRQRFQAGGVCLGKGLLIRRAGALAGGGRGLNDRAGVCRPLSSLASGLSSQLADLGHRLQCGLVLAGQQLRACRRTPSRLRSVAWSWMS